MQIKKIYLDLQEAKKEERFWNNVRTLESESFKDPLKLQIEYDPSDLKRLEDTKNEVNVRIEEMQRILDNEQEYISNLQKENKLLKEQLLLQEQETEKLKNEIQTDISKSEKVVNLLKENSINEKEKMYSEREARRKGFDKKLDDIGNEPKKYEYEAPIVKDKNKCCFKSICQEIVSLHEKKNKDYGNAADASYREFGIVSYVIRLNDKMNRLKSLTKPGVIQEVKDESIEDTLMDLAAYAIMALESIRNKV